MTLVTGKDANALVGRATAEAFVKEAKTSPVAQLHQEYAAFLGALSGGAQKEFNGFVLKNAPDVAALLKLGQSEGSASPALQRALQSAFDAAGDKLRFAPASGPAPFYGAHFAPVEVELSGQTYKVFVSAEEKLYQPPTRPEDSTTAILQRKDGALSTDLAFRVTG